MQVKDILNALKDIDAEMEVTTAISADCYSDYDVTYGLDPHFSVETLYEYRDMVLTDEDDVKERIADDYYLNDEEKINEMFLTIPVSKKLVITVAP
mgnify:CR=1 FL=1